MVQYLEMLEHVLSRGKFKSGTKGGGTLSVLGYQANYDLTEGFPLITSRSLEGKPWRALVYELLWFLSGSTNVKDLHANNVHLWDPWATPEISQKHGLPPGELGPTYAHQWRSFNGGGDEPIDQIARVVAGIKKDADSNRNLVTALNPAEYEKVEIIPCHAVFHFYHYAGELSMLLWQRSADVPVGVPFNIAEYALLLMMTAQVTGLKPREFVHQTSNTHIYADQIPKVKELLQRKPKPLPQVRINPGVLDIFNFNYADFTLENYHPHPAMKIPVAR